MQHHIIVVTLVNGDTTGIQYQEVFYTEACARAAITVINQVYREELCSGWLCTMKRFRCHG